MARQYSQADRDRFAAERRDQLERLQSQIAGRVTDLVNGAEWQQWLSVAAKFHQYSFNNTMLIMLQRPEATLVAGYKTWQTSFGRQVNKGETGIRILAPVTKQIEKHTEAPLVLCRSHAGCGSRLRAAWWAASYSTGLT